MKKNVAVLSLAVVALFSLVGCTKDNSTFQPKESEEDVEMLGHLSPTQKKKSWVVQLNGQNEVPAVITSTTGEARMNLYKNGPNHSLTYNILLKSIPAGTNITAAHIHMGAANTTGGVVLNLFGSGNGTLVNFGIQGQRTPISETFYNNLLNGEIPYYVNVHSNKNPGGEVRGQMEAGL